jgi:hypothetical protein
VQHSLQDHHPERLVPGRHNQNVGAAVPAIHLGRREPPRKADAAAVPIRPPSMMTALTAALGLLPLALSVG